MARQRMIHPDFWRSPHNEHLSFRQRLLWLGLISNADDEGRIKANPNFIRATVFPFDDLSSVSIKDDLALLTSEGLIIQYTNKEVDYIQIAKWGDFQKISHPQPSKIPAFEGLSLLNTNSGMIPEIIENDSGMIPEPFRNDSTPRQVKLSKSKEEKQEKEVFEVDVESQKLFRRIWGREGTPGQKGTCLNMVKNYGFEEVEKAFHIADDQGKYSLSYVRGILNNAGKDKQKINLKENRKIGI